MTWTRKTIGTRPALTYFESPSGGPEFLFLHGVARSAEDFFPLAEHLTPDWQVQALNFRGHGSSERTPGHYRVIDYVQDASVFLLSRPVRPRVVYGHSLGAMVALAAAAECPRQVAAVILEDPPFVTMGPHIGNTHWPVLFAAFQRLALRRADPDTIVGELSALEIPGPNGVPSRLGDLRGEASLRFTARCLTQMDPAVFEPVLEGRWLDGYEATDLYPRVQCPVLLLQGDPTAGGAMQPADAALALANIPHCQTRFFAGRGHLLHGEVPEEVLSVLHQFLTHHRLNQQAAILRSPPRPVSE